MTESKLMASRAGVRLMLAGLVLAVAGTLALTASAQERPWGPAAGGPGMMMGGGPGPMGPGARGGHDLFSGEPRFVARRVDHMLDGLGASEAQRSQIKQIAQAAAADLKAQHEANRSLRLRGLEIFKAPSIDAAAAESLRQQMLAQHDQASKRVMQAMLEIGRVLTPEQRASLVTRLQQRAEQMRERRQRWEREQPQR